MSSDSDEDFATYGTPLEPLEEDTIPKKRPVTIENQVATDKYGRRRFHGAFTGGFSAGFFNTVGSLEGWNPSQFTSSRSSKAKSQAQRPEDFMDDEDMDEFGIAPKMLRPTGNYNQESEGSSRKRSLMQFSDGPIPGIPVLKTLVEPVKETIGIKLLMKMGWKPGQGVGPRLSKIEKAASKKSQKQVKVYGCAFPNENDEQSIEDREESEDNEEFDMDITFAPDDYEPFIVKPKDNSFGLGYSGLDRKPVLSSHVNLFEPTGPSLVMQEKKKKVSIRGQAFGVGAFERDDDDIYSNEDMSQYDFALDTPQMLAEKRQHERKVKLALPSSTDVLDGFMLSSSPVIRKTYPPPALPQGFTPHHQVKLSRFSTSTTPTSQGQSVRLSANERAVLLNSETNPAKPPPQAGEIPKSVEVKVTTGMFRPFVADPEKQERYEQFLTLSKLGQTDKLKSLQPLTMTEWEQQRERVEFEQAARLYRPLSDAFSDRFTSATQPDDTTNPLAPVLRTSSADDDVREAAKLKMYGRLTRKVSEWVPHSILCKRFNIPQPGVSSSSLKPKTSRPKFSVFNFLEAAPFNVPATFNENNTSLVSEDRSTSTTDPINIPTTPMVVETHVVGQTDVKSAAKDDIIEQLAESTNKMDLYKAIFLSSSDESDGEDEKPKTKMNQVQTATEHNVLRNTSPPRGIFANLDFNSLNTKEKKSSITEDKIATDVISSISPPRGIFDNPDPHTLKKQAQTRKFEEISKSMDNVSQSDPHTSILHLEECEMYGPSLPNTLPQSQNKMNYVSTKDCKESDEEWVEMNDSSDSDKNHRFLSKKKSKKSHRKSKKHKEKKHKKKRK